jgi:hypothetical protein
MKISCDRPQSQPVRHVRCEGPLTIYYGAVMLSEALQRNAKHEARLSNISDYFLFAHRFKFDPRLKAWPRGLRSLRCSFASLRMTLPDDFIQFSRCSWFAVSRINSQALRRCSSVVRIFPRPIRITVCPRNLVCVRYARPEALICSTMSLFNLSM